MNIILPALAVGFAAFNMWLAVRIINRRKWCARRAALEVALILAYPLSIGPAIWLRDNALSKPISKPITTAYMPLVWLRETGPVPLKNAYWAYLAMWVEVEPD